MAYPVRQNIDGSVLMSDGTVQWPEGQSSANPLGDMAGKVIKGQIQDQVKGQVVPEVTPEIAPTVWGNMSGMAGSLGGAGALAGIGGGLMLGAKGIKDLLNKKETKGWEGWGGRATLGIATGGLSEVARLAGLGKKSTKDYEEERWTKLSPGLQGLRAANHPGDDDGTWKEGKYAGQKWSWDKALDLAKEDGLHGISWLGNADTFGDDWVHQDLEKQKAIVSRLAAEGLYKSDKGDILISDRDKEKAKAIYNEIISGKVPTTTAEAATASVAPWAEAEQAATLKPGANIPSFAEAIAKIGKGKDIDPGFNINQGKLPSNVISGGVNLPSKSPGKIGSLVANAVSAVSSGSPSKSSFEPNSSSYKSLTKDQKNDYWKKRNAK